jgi:hypothetical protein
MVGGTRLMCIIGAKVGDHLLAIPIQQASFALYLLLQQHDCIKKGFGSWRASWDVDINWNDSITSPHDSLLMLEERVRQGTSRLSEQGNEHKSSGSSLLRWHMIPC